MPGLRYPQVVRQRNLPFDVPLSSGMSVVDEAEVMLAAYSAVGARKAWAQRIERYFEI